MLNPGALRLTRQRSRKCVLLAALSLQACVSADVREGKRVLGMLEHLRDAEGPARDAQLGAISSLKTTVPVAETARIACADAYRALADTQRSIEEAKGPPVDRAKLDQAQESLGRAKTGHETCNSALMTLRRWVEHR